MSDLLAVADRLTDRAVQVAVLLTLAVAATVVVERAAVAFAQYRRRRIERRYQPIAQRALAGDAAAVEALVTSPRGLRIEIARILISPLYGGAEAARIARTREIFLAMSLIPVADRLLESRRWWRRALALRALGVLRIDSRAGALVSALDDANAEVRGVALDALADMRDPATLPAVVVRLHDETLHRGRRFAAIAAFGTACEPLLIDLAEVDAANRLNYARALAICGTSRSWPVLCRWAQDADDTVRAEAFHALGRIGLDEHGAALAVDALSGGDQHVRAMAAYALHGWPVPAAAEVLAQHLDDSWPVAVQAARSLKTMRGAGLAALQTSAARPDLAGLLARQTLWELSVR